MAVPVRQPGRSGAQAVLRQRLAGVQPEPHVGDAHGGEPDHRAGLPVPRPGHRHPVPARRADRSARARSPRSPSAPPTSTTTSGRGSVEAGKRADLVVLDRDLFAAAAEIAEAEVDLTLVDGTWYTPARAPDRALAHARPPSMKPRVSYVEAMPGGIGDVAQRPDRQHGQPVHRGRDGTRCRRGAAGAARRRRPSSSSTVRSWPRAYGPARSRRPERVGVPLRQGGRGGEQAWLFAGEVQVSIPIARSQAAPERVAVGQSPRTALRPCHNYCQAPLRSWSSPLRSEH